MKRVYVVILMFVLMSLSACSKEAKAVETTVSPTTVVETKSDNEEIQEIVGLVEEAKSGITQKQGNLEMSSFKEEFLSLECNEIKTIYEAPAERDAVDDFNEELFWDKINAEEVFTPEEDGDVEIIAKEKQSDDSWDVYVLAEWGEMVYQYSMTGDRVTEINRHDYYMYTEYDLPKLEERAKNENKGQLKTLTVEQMRMIYPDLPWDKDIIAPIRVDLQKTKDGRCYAKIVFPKGTGVYTTGIQKIDTVTNQCFFDVGDGIKSTAMVADYGYLIHDLYDNSVNAFFADLNFKRDWNDWRMVKFPLEANGSFGRATRSIPTNDRRVMMYNFN